MRRQERAAHMNEQPLMEYVARSVGAEASYELRYLYELLCYLVWLLLYKPAEIPHDTY